jgi:hypothetical protein
MKNAAIRHIGISGVWVLLLGSALALSGCATVNAKPYVSNDTTRQIKTSPTELHRFKYVHIEEDEDENEIVLYGKIEHMHAFCEKEAHIDLASVDAQGNVQFKRSLAIRKQSQRVRGWHGAAFRARIDSTDIGNGTLVLAFHDVKCHKDLTFDCSGNQAKAKANEIGPAADSKL